MLRIQIISSANISKSQEAATCLLRSAQVWQRSATKVYQDFRLCTNAAALYIRYIGERRAKIPPPLLLMLKPPLSKVASSFFQYTFCKSLSWIAVSA
jgi:hypothetical protein